MPKILTQFVFQRDAKEKKWNISLIIFEYLKYFDHTDLKYVKNFINVMFHVLADVFAFAVSNDQRLRKQLWRHSCCPLYQSAPTTTALLRKHSIPRSTAWLKSLLISAQTLLEVLGSTLESCTTGISPDATIHLPLAPWGFTWGYQSLHFLFWTDAAVGHCSPYR